jgi:SPP1 family predicted phage head-tail adaptor
MNAGGLRNILGFYKKVQTVTNTGSREFSLQLVKANVRGSAKTRMLSENFSADSENVIADVVINTRYDKALDINDLVIKFDNKELKVISVDNYNFKDKMLIFRCQYDQR